MSSHDFYGDALPERAVARFGSVRFLHDESLRGLTMSLCGSFLATWDDSSLIVWSVPSGEELLRIAHSAYAVRFSPDGSVLVIWSTDGEIRSYATASLGQIQSFTPGPPAGTGGVLCVSADSKFVALGDDDGVRLVSMETGQILQNLSMQKVITVIFTPDGSNILAAGKNLLVNRWDANTGELKATFRAVEVTDGSNPDFSFLDDDPFDRPLLSFSHDGSLLAVLSRYGELPVMTGRVHFWDVQAGLRHFVIDSGSASTSLIAFAPDDQTFATSNSGWNVAIWEFQPLRQLRAFQLDSSIGDMGGIPHSRGQFLELSGSTIAAVRGRSALIMDALTSVEVVQSHSEQLDVVAFAPDGDSAVTRAGKNIRFWEANTGKPIRKLQAGSALSPSQGSSSGIAAVSTIFSRTGSQLVASRVVATERIIQIWDADTGSPVQAVDGMSPICFSADGSLLAVVGEQGEDHRPVLYNMRDGSAAGELQFEPTGTLPRILAMAGTADNKLIGASTEFNPTGFTIRKWDLSTLALESHFVVGSDINLSFMNIGVAMSPGGTLLATLVWGRIGTEATLYVFNLVNQNEVLRISPVAIGPNAVGFAHDKQWLALGRGSSVELWDLETGTQIETYHGHRGLVTCVAFSTDDQFLLTGSRDRTALVWNSPN